LYTVLMICYRWQAHVEVPQTELVAKNSEPPSIVDLKDFLRFYASSSRGRVAGVPTTRTIEKVATSFFRGFERATGTIIASSDRDEIYSVSLKSLFAGHQP